MVERGWERSLERGKGETRREKMTTIVIELYSVRSVFMAARKSVLIS